MEDHFSIGPKLNSRVFSSWMKNSFPIRRFNSLFQHNQKLSDTGLSRTVSTEKQREGS